MDPYFRGQKQTSQIWVEGYYAMYPIAKKLQPCILQLSEDNTIKPIPVDPDTIGQSTGWIDSDKRRIYAGDFVEIICRSGFMDKYLIWFNEEKNCLCAINILGIQFDGKNYRNPSRYIPWSDFCGIMLDPYDEIESIKILGNIYNDPEFLVS